MPVAYRVGAQAPAAHLYDVTVTVTDAAAGTLTLALPAWIPGSYMIRDYARHVVSLVARDADGAVLPVAKTDKSTWSVDVAGNGTVTVSLRVYAWDLSVRGARGRQRIAVDDQRAGPTVLEPAVALRRRVGEKRVAIEIVGRAEQRVVRRADALEVLDEACAIDGPRVANDEPVRQAGRLEFDALLLGDLDRLIDQLVVVGHRVTAEPVRIDGDRAHRGGHPSRVREPGRALDFERQRAVVAVDAREQAGAVEVGVMLIEVGAALAVCPINHIETQSGGSVRCMLAEVHLPRRDGL